MIVMKNVREDNARYGSVGCGQCGLARSMHIGMVTESGVGDKTLSGRTALGQDRKEQYDQ